MGQDGSVVGVKEALLISIFVGIVVLACSSYYLHAKNTTWKTWEEYKAAREACKKGSGPACTEHTFWQVSGSLGVIVGALQIIFGIAALILMANGMEVGLGVVIAHTLFFLLALIAFIIMALKIVGDTDIRSSGFNDPLIKAMYTSVIADWLICLGIVILVAVLTFVVKK